MPFEPHLLSRCFPHTLLQLPEVWLPIPSSRAGCCLPALPASIRIQDAPGGLPNARTVPAVHQHSFPSQTSSQVCWRISKVNIEGPGSANSEILGSKQNTRISESEN